MQTKKGMDHLIEWENSLSHMGKIYILLRECVSFFLWLRQRIKACVLCAKMQCQKLTPTGSNLYAVCKLNPLSLAHFFSLGEGTRPPRSELNIGQLFWHGNLAYFPFCYEQTGPTFPIPHGSEIESPGNLTVSLGISIFWALLHFEGPWNYFGKRLKVFSLAKPHYGRKVFPLSTENVGDVDRCSFFLTEAHLWSLECIRLHFHRTEANIQVGFKCHLDIRIKTEGIWYSCLLKNPLSIFRNEDEGASKTSEAQTANLLGKQQISQQ